MSKIAVGFGRAVVFVAVTAIAFVSAGPRPVHAPSPAETGTSPAPTGERLEQRWARQQYIYERLGRFFDNADARVDRAQELIDGAKANDKDVSALQEALDGFADAAGCGRGGRSVKRILSLSHNRTAIVRHASRLYTASELDITFIRSHKECPCPRQ